VNFSMLRNVILAVVALSACLLPGCASVGPSKLVPTHEGYNDAVQLTLTREVLKNIVRGRYYDPSQFLSVSSINAQFSVGVQAGGRVTGIGTAVTAGEATGGVGYSDSPTITYVPQVGAGLYKSLGTPLELEEVLTFINFRQGRTVDIELVISSINYAPERIGPPGDAYRRNLAALSRLFQAGATLRYFRELRAEHYVSAPKDGVSARDLAEASKAGKHYFDKGDGTVGLASRGLATGLVVPLPHAGQTREALVTLGLTPGKPLYPVKPPSLAYPESVGLQTNTLWLTPRSAEGMLGLAKLTVEIPPVHQQEGIVPSIDDVDNTAVRLPMRIRHSSQEPASPYRIRHRGYWFYIDETDLESKRIFETLVTVFQSRLGSVEPTAGPLITLPVGRF